MEASCTVQTLRSSCKFFSESDKKELAKAISKNQMSDPGPSWPSCLGLKFGIMKPLLKINYRLHKYANAMV